MVAKAKPPIDFNASIFLPLIGFAGVIAVWWIMALSKPDLIPTPLEAIKANWSLLENPFSRTGPGKMGIGLLLLASLQRVLLGFLLGALVAIPLGFLIGMSKVAWAIFNPLIQIFKPVSPLAWLPIALTIFNLADPSAIFVIFITSLWPTIINTAAGVQSIPQDYLNVAQILGMPRWRQITLVMLPATLPYIFTGLRISLGIAWLVIVAVEMLTGGVGIGFFVWDEWNRLNLSAVLLAVILIGITGLFLDYGLGKIQVLVTHRK